MMSGEDAYKLAIVAMIALGVWFGWERWQEMQGNAQHKSDNLGMMLDAVDGSADKKPSKARSVIQQQTGLEKDKICASTRRLREAIQDFSMRYQRLPKSLEEMVEKQVMRQLPRDPTGRGWTYSPHDGILHHNVYVGC